MNKKNNSSQEENKLPKEENKKSTRSPWFFIPTQYFAEGVPFILTNQLSVAMYKSLEASNAFIGFTSFLYLPWSIKLFWGPLIDAYGTKRKWLIYMQLAMAICFVIVALTVQLPSFLFLSLVIFTAIAFLSASHDIATDGYYLHVLDKKNQAFFTGIRSTFYRLAMIVAGGVLVKLAGDIGESTGVIAHGWSTAFGIAAAIFILLFFYHQLILPHPVTDHAVKTETNKIPYGKIFKEYFSQNKIAAILSYILLYRFGEGLLLKMAQPFFLDKPEVGGLGLSLSDVGLMYGTFGIVALLIGGILGGWMIKNYGLKKLIWPFAFCMNVPNALYVYMSYFQPTDLTAIDLSFIPTLFGSSAVWTWALNPVAQACIIIEQFGYGIGFTAFMVFLLYTSKGEFKTSHFAISTGLMAVGMMIPGFVSGVIQMEVGYVWLFTLSVLTTIPGMITIFFLPLEDDDKE